MTSPFGSSWTSRPAVSAQGPVAEFWLLCSASIKHQACSPISGGDPHWIQGDIFFSGPSSTIPFFEDGLNGEWSRRWAVREQCTQEEIIITTVISVIAKMLEVGGEEIGKSRCSHANSPRGCHRNLRTCRATRYYCNALSRFQRDQSPDGTSWWERTAKKKSHN